MGVKFHKYSIYCDDILKHTMAKSNFAAITQIFPLLKITNQINTQVIKCAGTNQSMPQIFYHQS